MTEISVLNWSWVAVAILHLPDSLLRFEVLVGNIGEQYLVGWHDKLLTFIT